MTRKEVAAFFGVTEDTVTRWAAARLLCVYRTLGGRPRFKRVEMMQRLEQTLTGETGNVKHDPAMM